MASPIFLLPIFFILDMNTQRIVFNTVFLGSFHIILTPLFATLFSNNQTVSKLYKRVHYTSFIVFLLGLLLALLANKVLFSSSLTSFFSFLIILSASFHSSQQQFGIILSLTKVRHFSVVKICFYLLPLLTSLNFLLLVNKINDYQLILLIATTILAALALILTFSAGNWTTTLFTLRVCFWPISIYAKNLTPLVFALHGLEYLVYFNFVKHSIADDQQSRLTKNLDFYLTVAFVVISYTLGHFFLVQKSFFIWGEILLAFHFALQFRHYWLDRQFFKLSKPFMKTLSILK